MTSCLESLRLELLREKTMTDVWKQMRRLSASKEWIALRQEFRQEMDLILEKTTL